MEIWKGLVYHGIDHGSRYEKAVKRIDINTGKTIAVYKSVSDAARALGDHSYHKHIIDVCREKRKSAYGFGWEYANPEEADATDFERIGS